MSQGFLPGDELVRRDTGDALYQVVVRIPRIRSIRVLDLEQEEERSLKEDSLRRLVAAGELRVVRKGLDRERHVARRQSPADDEKLQAATRFVRTLDQTRKQFGVSLSKAHAMLVEQNAAAHEPDRLWVPSLSHALRLWGRFLNGQPLRLGDVNKGNRTPRYDDEVIGAVKDLAKTYFLKQGSVWTHLQLTKYINQELHAQALLPSDRAISQRCVKRVIHDELCTDTDLARMDPNDAKSAKAVAKQKIRISGLLERVEQDGLHLPFVVETIYGMSNDIWLVHAIDCCTSVPVGWCLVIGRPNVLETMKCIETILFPKAPRLEQLGIKCDFDFYGTPSQLVLDNGAENKGQRLQRLPQLGIDPYWLRSKNAKGKPFIERLNRSLKEALTTLPGCTRFNGVDGKRDPIALGDKPMKFEELERWIVRFFFEEWVNHPLERLQRSIFVDSTDLGASPRLRFRTLTEHKGYPVPLPPSLEAWRSVVYERVERTLARKTGISYATHQFAGDRLDYLIRQFGETKVQVLVDPDDFRAIYVLDRDGRSLVQLDNTHAPPGTPAYSYVRAAEILKTAFKPGVDSASQAFRRDVFLFSAGLCASPETGSKTTKKTAANRQLESKQTTKQAQDHSAVVRSREKQIPASTQSPALGQPPMSNTQKSWTSVSGLQVLDRKGKKQDQ